MEKQELDMQDLAFVGMAKEALLTTPVEVLVSKRGFIHSATIKAGPHFIGNVSALRRKTLLSKCDICINGYFNALFNI